MPRPSPRSAPAALSASGLTFGARARPLHELPEQALLLGRVAAGRSRCLLASECRVDLRLALSLGRLTIEPSLCGWDSLPAANGGRHVDAAPRGVPWRLPQLVEVGE